MSHRLLRCDSTGKWEVSREPAATERIYVKFHGRNFEGGGLSSLPFRKSNPEPVPMVLARANFLIFSLKQFLTNVRVHWASAVLDLGGQWQGNRSKCVLFLKSADEVSLGNLVLRTIIPHLRIKRKMLPENPVSQTPPDRKGTILASRLNISSSLANREIAYEKAVLTLYWGRTAKWYNVGAHPNSIDFIRQGPIPT